MIHSILVPLDGSTFGEHALPLALAIARRAGATLRLVHVHQAIPPANVSGVAVMDGLEVALKKQELAYLGAMVHRVSEAAPVHVLPALLDGEVASVLEAYVGQVGVEMVVMATHGRGAFRRFWLGSVADELVRHLRVPVLLVHPRDEAPDLKQEPSLKHVLLPLDGTHLAEQMIEPALELGQLMGSRFTLLRAIRPVLRPDYWPDGGTLEGMTDTLLERARAHEKQLHDEAQRYLDGVAEHVRGRGLPVETHVLVGDQPAAAILREAKGHGADLIALETHGRRGLARLLLGSVADKVVRGSPVPVLVHRPQA
jgi:nucleotide-binding universal stress UspA family protein